VKKLLLLLCGPGLLGAEEMALQWEMPPLFEAAFWQYRVYTRAVEADSTAWEMIPDAWWGEATTSFGVCQYTCAQPSEARLYYVTAWDFRFDHETGPSDTLLVRPVDPRPPAPYRLRLTHLREAL